MTTEPLFREDEASIPSRVRVLIADDDLGVRRVLKKWLDGHGMFEVIGEAADGPTAISAAHEGQPHLVVLALALPEGDGLTVATEIRRLLPDTRIVIRSALSAARMAERAIDAGADVYLEK